MFLCVGHADVCDHITSFSHHYNMCLMTCAFLTPYVMMIGLNSLLMSEWYIDVFLLIYWCLWLTGAFLIPYVIMMALIGMPLLFMEYAFGQYFGVGGLTVFKRVCPIFQGEFKAHELMAVSGRGGGCLGPRWAEGGGCSIQTWPRFSWILRAVTHYCLCVWRKCR